MAEKYAADAAKALRLKEKGWSNIAIAKELKLPVKLVGAGEKMTDLKAFSPDDFIEALFEG